MVLVKFSIATKLSKEPRKLIGTSDLTASLRSAEGASLRLARLGLASLGWVLSATATSKARIAIKLYSYS